MPSGPGATLPGAAIYVLIDPAHQSVHCGSGRVHKHTRTVRWVIPADCLGNPAWVRVASGATFHVSPELTYDDDARRDGVVGHTWKYGRR